MHARPKSYKTKKASASCTLKSVIQMGSFFLFGILLAVLLVNYWGKQMFQNREGLPQGQVEHGRVLVEAFNRPNDAGAGRVKYAEITPPPFVPKPEAESVISCAGLTIENFCELLLREDCSEETPRDTCGQCFTGFYSQSGIEDGPHNSACFPDARGTWTVTSKGSSYTEAHWRSFTFEGLQRSSKFRWKSFEKTMDVEDIPAEPRQIRASFITCRSSDMGTWVLFLDDDIPLIGGGCLNQKLKISKTEFEAANILPEPQAEGDCKNPYHLVDAPTVNHSALYLNASEFLYDGIHPYKDFYTDINPDYTYPHTNVPDRFVVNLFNLTKPKFIVEFGSFKGGSAIRMAKALKKLDMDADALIICVDPWIGDAMMWTNHDGWRKWLLLKNGHPQVHSQFLVNVIDSKQHDIILPLQTTSIVGIVAMWEMHQRGIIPLADLIYLDSAHERDETLLEVQRAMRNLKPGGYIFGDDWKVYGVNQDIRRYSKTDEGKETIDFDIGNDLSLFDEWDDEEERGEVLRYGVVKFEKTQWLLRKKISQEHEEEDTGSRKDEDTG